MWFNLEANQHKERISFLIAKIIYLRQGAINIRGISCAATPQRVQCSIGIIEQDDDFNKNKHAVSRFRCCQ